MKDTSPFLYFCCCCFSLIQKEMRSIQNKIAAWLRSPVSATKKNNARNSKESNKKKYCNKIEWNKHKKTERNWMKWFDTRVIFCFNLMFYYIVRFTLITSHTRDMSNSTKPFTGMEHTENGKISQYNLENYVEKTERKSYNFQ